MNGFTEIMSAGGALSEIQTKSEILACNGFSSGFGLTLSDSDAAMLTERRKKSLAGAGRVEFGGTVMPKLIRAFAPSPFIEQSDYADTLAEIQDAFYYYKTESEDKLTDDELIEYMAEVFNGRAQGSVDYLAGTSLAELCRYARNGYDENDADEAGDLF